MAHATYFASSTEPKRLPAARESLGDFVQRHAERRIALVTSGGTTVPLEKNTVRFIDNFSTGNRGAASVEQLLKADYAVVFVYRTHSAFPSWFTPRRSGIRRDVRRWCWLAGRLRLSAGSASVPAGSGDRGVAWPGSCRPAWGERMCGEWLVAHK